MHEPRRPRTAGVTTVISGAILVAACNRAAPAADEDPPTDGDAHIGFRVASQ